MSAAARSPRSFLKSVCFASLLLLTTALAAPLGLRADDLLQSDDCALYLTGLIRAIEAPGEEIKPLVIKARGTQAAISRAMEKEGLFYEDIADWFDVVESSTFLSRLETRLQKESTQKVTGPLTQWLRQWSSQYRATELSLSSLPDEVRRFSTQNTKDVDPRLVLELLASFENPFDVINIRGRSELFAMGALTFDDLRSSFITPAFITVGDDLGSWEIRSRGGEADLRSFDSQRKIVENFLEGKIGHQHIMHAWPDQASERSAVVGQYIGLLDTTASYLFWRQIKRGDDVESIAGHPYLGLYAKASLDRLAKAMIEGNPSKFNDKFRMVGARSFPGNPNFEGQSADKKYPDWELRSGNKGAKRTFIENMVLARLATGDYSGIRDYRSYDFDLSAPIHELTAGILSQEEISVLEEMQRKFKFMNWSGHGKALNHFRNKIISPLAPWENRLPLSRAKLEKLRSERAKYARALAQISRRYLIQLQALEGQKGAALKKAELTQSTMTEIEGALRTFAQATALDVELERALKPVPKTLPSILVSPVNPSVTQRVDPNRVALGIEYSFRFSDSVGSAAEAEAEILEGLEAFKAEMGGGEIERLADGGHGHGLSIKYIYTDPEGQRWRFEWDGVGRSYRNGKPYWRRNGHIEVPTPKFTPKTMETISKLFRGMRSGGKFPRRSAGGAHVNIDIGWLQALPENVGARLAADFIALFESNREMIAALWQHPYRVRNAMPAEIRAAFAYQLTEFKGGWEDLGKLLYRHQYFNSYVGRKPSYMQLNAIALMGNSIPEDYLRSLDIKNPANRWFPSFGGKGSDRLELRLFDAPEDEYMAALQIKYVRAFIDRAWNSPNAIPLRKRYNTLSAQQWRENPEVFIADAELHLKWLGLDVNEFMPLIVQSLEIQNAMPATKPAPKKATKIRMSEEEVPEDFEFRSRRLDPDLDP